MIRYELPAMNALNFMLENALGGGGIASLRIDPQGKALHSNIRYASEGAQKTNRLIINFN